MPAKSRTAAAAPAAAPAAAAPAPQHSTGSNGFTFGDAAVPEKTRVSTAVNPLLDVCKSIAEKMDAETGRSTVAKTVTAADANQVAKIKRWLALAGTEVGVTFRSVVDDHNVVTFWAVTRIEHKNRKPRNGGTA